MSPEDAVSPFLPSPWPCVPKYKFTPGGDITGQLQAEGIGILVPSVSQETMPSAQGTLESVAGGRAELHLWQHRGLAPA